MKHKIELTKGDVEAILAAHYAGLYSYEGEINASLTTDVVDRPIAVVEFASDPHKKEG